MVAAELPSDPVALYEVDEFTILEKCHRRARWRIWQGKFTGLVYSLLVDACENGNQTAEAACCGLHCILALTSAAPAAHLHTELNTRKRSSFGV
jgi:hypothetical protein